MEWVQPTATLMQASAPILQALAWPTAVIVVAAIFHTQIRGLLPDLKRVRAGLLEAEFERRRAEVEAEVGTPPAEEQRPYGDSRAELRALAAVSPSAAVLEAYRRVEQVLFSKTQHILQVEPRRLGGVGLARFAAQHELIPPASVRAIEGISVLRMLVAHGREEATFQQAMEYLDLVDAVLYSLDQPQQTQRPAS